MMNSDSKPSNVTSTATLPVEPKQPQHSQQPQPMIPAIEKDISRKMTMKPPPQPSAQLKQPPPTTSSQPQHAEPEPIRQKGPIHVLMSMPSSRSISSAASVTTVKPGGRVDSGKPRSKPTKRERMQRLLLDPVLQGDYVSKRLNAYQRSMPKPGEIKDEKKKTPQQQQQAKTKGKASKKNLNPNSTSWTSPTSVWDGVSQVERDLVKCCESATSSSPSSYLEGYSASSDGQDEEDQWTTRGALQIEKEVEFVGILARDCHSLSAKSLALAILERTLQLHLIEEVEEEEEDGGEEDVEMKDATTKRAAEKTNMDSPSRATRSGSKRGSVADESTPEQPAKKQKLDDNKSESAPAKAASTKEQEESQEEDEEVEEEEEEDDDGPPMRLEGFLAASGLKILNRWLIDACEEETEAPSKTAANGKTQVPKLKPPATRPLILPMLRFLERIPFDKKVVLDAKINKQIRKLGKQVTAIRKAMEQNTHEPVDLQNWSLDPTVDAKDALDDVHQAVKDLKSSWERMAKQDPRQFDDPFGSLKSTMKERLDVLLQYEVGEAPKPDWFDDVEAAKNSTKKPPPKSKFSNTKELAAKERLAEAEHLKSQLRAAQTEHRERLAQLREKFRQRRDADVAAAPSNGRKKNGKRVVWKDGLRSQVNRNRQELEQVFVFDKTTPAARDHIEITDDDPEEDGPLVDVLMTDADADADGLL